MKSRRTGFERASVLAFAIGVAGMVSSAGCKKGGGEPVDREAQVAKADWKNRVAEAQKYALRRQNKDPIVSAVGVKELPARTGAGAIDLGGMTLTAAASPEERARLRERVRGAIPVVMYATSWCGVCAAARGYMKTNGVAYTERDVERDPDAQLSCLSINPRCSVPTFDVDGLVMVGFRGKRFDAMIERATDLRLERMLERQPKTTLAEPPKPAAPTEPK